MFLKCISGDYILVDKISRFFINGSQDIFCELTNGNSIRIYAAPLYGQRDKRISYQMYMEKCLEELVDFMMTHNSYNIVDMNTIVDKVSIYDYRC